MQAAVGGEFTRNAGGMGRELNVDEARALLRTRGELLDCDVTARSLSASAGQWRRVQRGVYVPRDAVADLWPQADLRLRAVAAAARMRGGNAVVSHVSAAVLHGLAIPVAAGRPVEVTVAGDVRMSSRPGLKRHLDGLTSDDVVDVDGTRCTSVERTVFGVARTASLEAALCGADAAARRMAVDGRAFHPDAQEMWRERLQARARAASRRRGITRARWILEFLSLIHI